jgi:hypothetical protein
VHCADSYRPRQCRGQGSKGGPGAGSESASLAPSLALMAQLTSLDHGSNILATREHVRSLAHVLRILKMVPLRVAFCCIIIGSRNSLSSSDGGSTARFVLSSQLRDSVTLETSFTTCEPNVRRPNRPECDVQVRSMVFCRLHAACCIASRASRGALHGQLSRQYSLARLAQHGSTSPLTASSHCCACSAWQSLALASHRRSPTS